MQTYIYRLSEKKMEYFTAKVLRYILIKSLCSCQCMLSLSGKDKSNDLMGLLLQVENIENVLRNVVFFIILFLFHLKLHFLIHFVINGMNPEQRVRE